jgi:hypothetical protein
MQIPSVNWIIWMKWSIEISIQSLSSSIIELKSFASCGTFGPCSNYFRLISHTSYMILIVPIVAYLDWAAAYFLIGRGRASSRCTSSTCRRDPRLHRQTQEYGRSLSSSWPGTHTNRNSWFQVLAPRSRRCPWSCSLSRTPPHIRAGTSPTWLARGRDCRCLPPGSVQLQDWLPGLRGCSRRSGGKRCHTPNRCLWSKGIENWYGNLHGL